MIYCGGGSHSKIAVPRTGTGHLHANNMWIPFRVMSTLTIRIYLGKISLGKVNNCPHWTVTLFLMTFYYHFTKTVFTECILSYESMNISLRM